MKRFATIVGIISAIFANILSAPAFAASSSSASLSNLTVTLIDLDLSDGITPSLTWLDTGETSAYIKASDPVNSNEPFLFYYDPSKFSPLSDSVATLQSQASAAITGTGFNTAGYQAFGSALGNSSLYSSSAYGLSRFTLSAHTQANFLASAYTQATTTVGSDGTNFEDATGQVILRAYTYSMFGNSTTEDRILSTANYSYDPITNLYSEQSFSNARSLSVAFYNTGAFDLTGGLLGLASVNGYSNVTTITAVPEPETYSMLLVGLSLVGFFLRAKKLA